MTTPSLTDVTVRNDNAPTTFYTDYSFKVINCTQSDLDAITASRDDVEILDYNSELYYEKYYEYVKDIKMKK